MKCHAQVKAPDGAGSDHLHQQGVRCTSCHDPHASDVAGLMRTFEAAPEGAKPAGPAGGRALACASCHVRIAAALTSDKPHAPFATGKCEVCHGTHAAPQKNLLIAPEKELCARCHDLAKQQPELHSRPEVAGASCSSCHDPHGTPRSGTKAAAFIHQPYAAANCTACHTSLPDSPEKLTAGKAELCAACHGEVATAAAGESACAGSGR